RRPVTKDGGAATGGRGLERSRAFGAFLPSRLGKEAVGRRAEAPGRVSRGRHSRPAEPVVGRRLPFHHRLGRFPLPRLTINQDTGYVLPLPPTTLEANRLRVRIARLRRP